MVKTRAIHRSIQVRFVLNSITSGGEWNPSWTQKSGFGYYEWWLDVGWSRYYNRESRSCWICRDFVRFSQNFTRIQYRNPHIGKEWQRVKVEICWNWVSCNDLSLNLKPIKFQKSQLPLTTTLNGLIDSQFELGQIYWFGEFQ